MVSTPRRSPQGWITSPEKMCAGIISIFIGMGRIATTCTSLEEMGLWLDGAIQEVVIISIAMTGFGSTTVPMLGFVIPTYATELRRIICCRR
ncbi:unnamed protein product [Somion occarium]|uniref:Uncharacterized protein n=1 Tax=Somion occarium TaxID=3059160 RepID=A0ABP1CTS5_9APHY